MARLVLHFFSVSDPQLDRVEYWPVPSPESKRISARGACIGRSSGTGFFPYTAGVRALSALVLSTKLAFFDGHSFSLTGEAGSLAASLDYAVAKRNLWLQDMFGVTQAGELMARRLLVRVNPERKRPGPVSISLNVDHLPVENVSISLGGELVGDRARLEFLLHRVAGTKSETTIGDVGIVLPLGHRAASYQQAAEGVRSAESVIASTLPTSDERLNWTGWLRETVSRQVAIDLSTTSLFAPCRFRETMARASCHRLFERTYGKALLRFEAEALMQRSPAMHSSDEIQRAFSKLKHELCVMLTPLQPANIAIFHAMRLAGVPIRYDFTCFLSSDLVRQALRGGCAEAADLLVTGIAAGSDLATRAGRKFKPIAMMARGTQRIVEMRGVAERRNGSKRRVFHVGPGSENNTYWAISHLLQDGLLTPSKVSFSEISPTDFFLNAWAGAAEGVSCLAFPFIHYLPPMVRPVTDIQVPHYISDKETLLFGSKEIVQNRALLEMLVSCMYDQWLQLLEFPIYRERVVTSLCDDTLYLQNLGRALGYSIQSLVSGQVPRGAPLGPDGSRRKEGIADKV